MTEKQWQAAELKTDKGNLTHAQKVCQLKMGNIVYSPHFFQDT